MEKTAEEKLARFEEAIKKLRELRNKKQQEFMAEKEKLLPSEINERVGYLKGLFEVLKILEEIK